MHGRSIMQTVVSHIGGNSSTQARTWQGSAQLTSTGKPGCRKAGFTTLSVARGRRRRTLHQTANTSYATCRR